MNIKTINLDVSKKLYEKLVAKQGDTKSRFLLFNLSSGGAAINLTSRSVRVYAVKPDGREVFNDLVISDPTQGTCILELTNQMLAIPGIVKMELMITEGLKKLTSFEFELEVIKSLNSETAIVSTNEFTALINGLASLNEYDKYKKEIDSARGDFFSLLERLNNSDLNKVDKITGKGLSTNDYTNADQTEVKKIKNKADDSDSSRTTTAKDVTGAINELNSKKANKSVSALKPTLVNGWNNYTNWDASFKEAIYYKDEFGIVHFEGTLVGGTNGYPFIFPVNYKPSKTITFPVVAKTSTSDDKIIVLQGFVDKDGNMGTYEYSTSNVRVTFNFSFKV